MAAPMSEPVFLVVSIVVLLLGNGFFSGSEIAVVAVRRSRIEALIEEGSRAAKRVKALQDKRDRFLATVQVGVTVTGTLAGVFGGVLAARHLAPALGSLAVSRWVPPILLAVVLVGVPILYVQLVIGELVPRALALRYAETLALLVSAPLKMLLQVSGWMVRFLGGSARLVMKMAGVGEAGPRTFVSVEEIRHLARKGGQQGILDQTEMEIIHGVFDLAETAVRSVMVPRPKVFALDADTLSSDVGRLIVESGFSRIPISEGSIDNIIGVVYAKDVLRVLQRGEPVVVRQMLHRVPFVPEAKKVGALLKELQRRRTHLAVVVNEHGSVSGIVTMEDILEEIVGEIRDEYDWEERPVERLRDGSLVVEGTVSAEELREAYGVPLPESSDFETVAGFMLDRLGSLPGGGEVVTVGEWRLTVVDVERNRVSRVKIEPLARATRR
jgi:putative hemolysin